MNFFKPEDERVGLISVENLWRETFSSIKTTHYLDGFLHVDYFNKHFYIVKNINDKEMKNNSFYFSYYIGVNSPFNYWQLEIITESGVKYITKERLYCSVSHSGDENVMIRVDEEFKRIYISFFIIELFNRTKISMV